MIPIFVGHSHLGALMKANAESRLFKAEFINLRHAEQATPEDAVDRLRRRDEAPVVFHLHGNEHNSIAIALPQTFRDSDKTQEAVAFLAEHLERQAQRFDGDLATLEAAGRHRKRLLICPPPPSPERHVREFPAQFREIIDEFGVSPAPLRVECWRLWRYRLAQRAVALGMTFVDAPPEAIDGDGLLKQVYCIRDPVHASPAYGELVMRRIAAILGRPVSGTSEASTEQRTPYARLPRSNWWTAAVANVASAAVDPVVAPKFLISRHDRVVTAGSCFAQHVARRLLANGFRYHVTEPAPDGMSEEDARRANYGVYSARYGNVYTARQFDQLIDRAFGRFRPFERIWRSGDRAFDPFRPQIQEGGFASEDELEHDRTLHLAAVRRAIEEGDIFIFTLGLTEAWYDRRDGAVFPTVPGAGAGRFDETTHAFHNFTLEDVLRDLRSAIGKIRAVRPGMRFLLTLSPVPLKATATKAHVLAATTYSKSVLRVAAAAVAEGDPDCDYFPSYEIITGPHARGAYFSENLRDVTREGVDHVMEVLLRHYAPAGRQTMRRSRKPARIHDPAKHIEKMARIGDVVCDEEILAGLDSLETS